MTFGRHGIPGSLVSDNGPAYASDEFRKFATQWEFQHITTSPHYAQSNGKAESAVKICKALLKKAQLAKTDINLALLNHRNTPTEPTNLSPAQRLFGRRTQTLLPLSAALLKPETPQKVPSMLKAGQRRQTRYYNRTAKSLVPLKPGDSVRLRLPGNSTWSPGICKEQVAPRSYIVESNGKVYRRNRRHLRKTSDMVPVHRPDIELGDSDSEIGEERSHETESESTNTTPEEAAMEETTNNASDSSQVVPLRRQMPLQRASSFGRIIRPPKRYAEQVDTQ